MRVYCRVFVELKGLIFPEECGSNGVVEALKFAKDIEEDELFKSLILQVVFKFTSREGYIVADTWIIMQVKKIWSSIKEKGRTKVSYML